MWVSGARKSLSCCSPLVSEHLKYTVTCFLEELGLSGDEATGRQTESRAAHISGSANGYVIPSATEMCSFLRRPS